MKFSIQNNNNDSDNEDNVSVVTSGSEGNNDMDIEVDNEMDPDIDLDNVPGDVEGDIDDVGDDNIDDGDVMEEEEEDIVVDSEGEFDEDMDEDTEIVVPTDKKKSLNLSTNLNSALDMPDGDSEDEDDENIEDVQVSGVLGEEEYEDDEDEDPETYLQKFDEEINQNYLMDEHYDQFHNNYDEIDALANLVRDKNNNIVDSLHTTIPYLTKYERARVLGQRAKQINSGSKPYVTVPENVIDGFFIAQMELMQKRIPFIIQRPIYGGGCEYWRLKDLEIL